MAFWWVNQGITYKAERAGGYLWAPKHNNRGAELHHWSAMRDVRDGDVIFSYADMAIRAVSVAAGAAFECPRPHDLGTGEEWESDGWRVNVTYKTVDPVPFAAFAPQLLPLMPDRYAPLKRTGDGANQGYLFVLPPEAGRVLLEHVGAKEAAAPNDVVAASMDASVETQRSAVVLARVGQGKFREQLLAQWKGRCAITSIGVPALLRASHIKPWADSNNVERLDQFNGLLLSPTYDAAFDAGLITFNDDGVIQLSDRLSPDEARRCGIDPEARLPHVEAAHREYLAYHRKYRFGRR